MKAVNDAEQQAVRGETRDILRTCITFVEILGIGVDIIILRKVALNSNDWSLHGWRGIFALKGKFSSVERNSVQFVPFLYMFFASNRLL